MVLYLIDIFIFNHFLHFNILVFSVHTIELYLLYRTYPEVISANQNAVGSYDHSQEYDPYHPTKVAI
jgi:hypothetical protein